MSSSEAPKQILDIDFSSQGISDIPDPSPCSCCTAPTQRELLEFESSTSMFNIFVSRIPGYGCTSCGLKEFDVQTSSRMLLCIANELEKQGDIAGREQFYRENGRYDEARRRRGETT